MSATRPRGATKFHWIALVVLLLTLACALGLHGWVTGQVSGAGTIRKPGAYQQVPAAVRNGGPVIGPHAGLVDTLRIPARTIVLTFDDGPDPEWTPKVLDVLARHDVPGTFFVLGSEVLRHPDLVRRAIAEGHEIGNHSFTHPDLTEVSTWQQQWQLSQAQLALIGVTGRTTTIMRPPYSFSNDSLDDVSWRLTKEVHDEGYVTVLADLDGRDWERPGVDAIVRNSTPKNGRGAIVLLHDAGGERSQTVAALDALIPKLQAQGYRFATLSEAVGLSPYHEATASELWRGRALLWATEGSGWVATALAGVLVGSALQLVLIPYFGHLSDQRGRRPVYLAGAVGAAIWAFVFFALLDTKEPVLVVLAAVVGLVFHAAMYGPQAAFITELFGTEVRYSGASLGYQLAGILGGALAPIISITLLDRFDSTLAISIYVLVMLLITLGALIVARETAAVDLAADRPEEQPPREGALRPVFH